MTKKAERCWDVTRGWQLVWLSALPVMLKLLTGFVIVDYALREKLDFATPPHTVL